MIKGHMIKYLLAAALTLVLGPAQAQFFPGYGPQNNFYVGNGSTTPPSWYTPANSRNALGMATWAVPTGIVPLANGGLNQNLTASIGGILWSDATQINILPGTSTPAQCLLSGNLAAPYWGSCAGGAAVSSVTANANGTLTISPTTGAVVAGINLSNANTWAGLQTFANGGAAMLGNSTGKTTFTSANLGASNYTFVFPAVSDTAAVLGTAQTFTANQNFTGGLQIGGTPILANATSSSYGAVKVDGTTITAAGGVISAAVGNSQYVPPPGGRLTLVPHTPVMTTTQAAKTTIYYDSYVSGFVPVYNGSADILVAIGSNEISTNLQSSSTGVINISGVFDVWAINVGGTLTLCVATNGGGGGWASDTGGSNTARGTGYTQLDNHTRAYRTNANSITNCYNGPTQEGPVSANQGTYLGTFYSTAAGQTAWQYGTQPTSGHPTAGLFGIFNAYNQVEVSTQVSEGTASWTYASTTFHQVDASAGNQVQYVDGLALNTINATATALNASGYRNNRRRRRQHNHDYRHCWVFSD